MRIGVDVMGGDHAPGAILDGVLQSLAHLDADDQLVLAGDEAVIRRALQEATVTGDQVEVVPTTQTIAMDESPVEAVRSKPDSPIAVLARLAGRRARNPIDIFISAGNTGAQVTAAQMYMRRLPNVHRPGIAVAVPTFSGPVVLIDVGANIEPKPHHLAQYGVMGEVYAEKIFGVARPRVALMNVGGEEQKGTADMKRARDMLVDVADIDFIGYVEGRSVFNGAADVVITDGVVGNVMIKLAEGLSEGLFKAIFREVQQSDPSLAAPFQKVVKKLYDDYDYHEYGGAPLLGVNGVCIINHGSSEARTICNAIIKSRQFVNLHVNEDISRRLGAVQEVVV